MSSIHRNLTKNHFALKCWVFFYVGAMAICSSMSQSSAEMNSQFTDIKFHIESVERESDPTACPITACQATKVTIHGFAIQEGLHKTEYVLNCTELTRLEPAIVLTASCGDVHANSDYKARLFTRGISFWPSVKYTPPPYHNIFNIISEHSL